MTQSIELPYEIFDKIMNNSFLIRKQRIHPLAQIVKSNDFQFELIKKYRGYPKRPLKSGSLYPKGNKISFHSNYKFTRFYKNYYENRKNKYNLNKKIYSESIKLFDEIWYNFLNIDIDILFEKYYNKLYYDDDDDDDYYYYYEFRFYEDYENEYYRFF